MKILKTFIVLISLLYASEASACADDTEWYANDIFVLVQPLSDNSGYENYTETGVSESTGFWYNYTGKRINHDDLEQAIRWLEPSDFTKNPDNLLLKTLLRNKDTKAYNFLRLNTKFNDMIYANSWDYEVPPTTADFQKIYNEVSAITSTPTLAPRVTFLKMRCLFKMNRLQQCIDLYNRERNNIRSEALRNRMKGYVAGVYVKQKKYEKALEIYYSLGDNQSIQTCVNQLLSADGMNRLYTGDPNSLTLRYIAQDYANYYYHIHRTKQLSSLHDNGLITSKKGWQRIDNDYDKIVTYAEKIVDEKKTTHMAFWMSFVGFMKWLHNEPDAAYAWFCKAEKTNTNDVEADHIRAFKLLASLSMTNKPDNFEDYFLQEYKHFYKKAQAEFTGDFDGTTYYNSLVNYWQNFTDDVYTEACNCFKNDGIVPLLLCAGAEQSTYLAVEHDEDFHETLNNNTSIEDLKSILNVLKEGGNSKVEQGLIDILSPEAISKDMLRDVIGTRYIRECKFDEAKKYLEKVPAEFFQTLSVAPYLENRHWTNTAFGRHDYSYLDDDSVTVTRNAKLQFVNDAIEMESGILMADGTAKAEQLYKMANILFQASCMGDCWALSDYSWTGYKDNTDSDSPLVKKAVEMLREAISLNNDHAFRKQCYFALASIPCYDAEGNGEYYLDWETNRYKFEFKGWQLEAYKNLSNLVTPSDRIYKTCDVLRSYMSR